MKPRTIKVINHSDNELPSYATLGSAGMDIRSNENDFFLSPMERKVVKTGVYMRLPESYEAQVRPRSGLAAKKGITVLNAPGTIDSDYIGEVGVILINLSDRVASIEKGMRIAQLVIAKYEKLSWEEVEFLDDTTRGSGGFGSTGEK